MLKIENLNIEYKKTIFKNANITFYDGNIHGIVGKSGSGKTTLIKSILNQNDTAYMYYDGESINYQNKEDFLLQHVAFVDQTGSYFENMTIFQHFQFYADLIHKTVKQQEIHNLLKRVGINNVNLKASPSVLSIGERKRFLIALALYSEKDIIILDEPTASLDKKNIAILKKVLQNLKDKTIILTTHEEGLLDICDVVYEIKEYEIECIKNEKKEVEKKTCERENHFQMLPYLKYKNSIQWLQQIFIVVLGIFLCVQLGTITKSVYDFSNGYINNNYLVEDQMIYFRKNDSYQDTIFVSGDQMHSALLEENELANIQALEGVEAVHNFDFLSTVNPNNTLEFQEIEVFRDSQFYASIYESLDSRGPIVFPYYPENKINKENNKQYVSYQFAKDNNIQPNDVLKVPVYVPTSQYADENERYISYKIVELEIKVDGILDSNEGFRSPETEYMIYIPNDDFQNILNKYNGEENAKDQKPYNDGLKRENYSYNDYVIFARKGMLKEVYHNLVEMDENYDVFSQSIFYLDSLDETESFMNVQYLIIGGISLVGIVIFLTVTYFYLKSRRNERKLLIYNGISKGSIRNYLFIESLIHFIIWIIGSMLVVSIIRKEKLFFFVFIILVLVSFILLLLEHLMIRYTLYRENKEQC